MIGSIIASATYFFWYELIKKKFDIKPIEVIKNMMGSFFAGIITSILVNPFSILNAKMAVANVTQNLKNLKYI